MTERGGILVVHKPIGATSFDVVSKVRRWSRVRRVGHCGTLDPFAEGVLPVCLGRATGLVRFMEGYDKGYRVTVRFGTETDTQDRTGKVTGGREPSSDELEDWRRHGDERLRILAAGLVGERMQVPPMYSAVKVGGRPLYSYARQGLEAERKARRIVVHEAQALGTSVEGDVLRAVLDIRCSKGTYIRSLCQDLGRSTGYGAHAEALLRTACGPFGSSAAHRLEDIGSVCQGTADPVSALRERGWLLPLESALEAVPSVLVDRTVALRLVSGRDVPAGDLHPAPDAPALIAVLYGEQGLLAVCRLASDDGGEAVYRTERVFADRDELG